MSSGDVLQFAARVLEREGALVEPAGPDTMEAMLPGGLRRKLDLEELTVLTDGSREGHSCGYGTETLIQLVKLAIAGGRTAAFRVNQSSHPPRPPESFTGLNVTFRVLQTWSTWGWILAGFARYRASCDDQREGLVQASVSVPEGVSVSVPDFSALPLEKISPDRLSHDVLRSSFPELSAALRKAAVRNLSAFREAVNRRHARDAERIRRYFKDAARDLRRRLGNRSAPVLRSKLESLPAEQERRLAQLEADCALRVRLEIVGLVALNGPGAMAELEVRRRKHRKVLPVRYDGIGRRWMGLRCDGCGDATLAFAMCDEAAHVHCPTCWDSCGTGGHRPCFRCEGKPIRQPWSEARPTQEGGDEASS